MNTKQQILALLSAQTDRFVSGEEIAKTLNVSRSAVWKSINSLRNDGYVINAVENRGYMLSIPVDVISANEIRQLVGKPQYIDVYKTIASTNETAKQYAQSGKGEGVIIASAQTGGKGRLGRSFFSPSDSGIYMSFLLRPSYPAEKAVSLTTMAAVAVAESIEEIAGVSADIKWVNDVYVGGKKASGILTEAAISMETGTLDYAIVGIGINVYPPKNGFPTDIENIAGFLLPTLKNGTKNKLIASIINRFFEYYTSQKTDYVSKYRRRSFVIGKQISVISGDNKRNAIALDVDENCRLKVRYENGELATLSSGEISVRLK